MNIREEFPELNVKVHGKELVYLDNAATTLKPKVVIDAVNKYYTEYNANIHRGVHTLSQKATEAYENVRAKVKEFINAKAEKEIIFTKGTTESINLVANCFGLQKDDEVVISEMEHHSNIVPWQLVVEKVGIKLKVIPISDSGEINLDKFKELLNENTKLVSVVHISNSLGTINSIKDIVKLAHEAGAKVVVDGAQAVAHTKVDVKELDCDFYAFSAHKMFGPTGVGVLYGKQELLDKMSPYQGGGDMIKQVMFEKTTFADLPHKFEAGTPNIAGVIGLGKAIEFIENIGLENIESREKELCDYAVEQLSGIPSVKLIGTPARRAGIVSFIVKNIHPHDIGTFLDNEGIAVRTGHHCTQPVMDRYNVEATTRISLSIYNTKEEIDKTVEALKKCVEFFK